jgi:hypothetical protein
MITADPTVPRAMVVDVMATPGSTKLQQKDRHLSHVAMVANMAAFESFLWLRRPSATVVFLTREVGELCTTSHSFSQPQHLGLFICEFTNNTIPLVNISEEVESWSVIRVSRIPAFRTCKRFGNLTLAHVKKIDKSLEVMAAYFPIFYATATSAPLLA